MLLVDIKFPLPAYRGERSSFGSGQVWQLEVSYFTLTGTLIKFHLTAGERIARKVEAAFAPVSGFWEGFWLFPKFKGVVNLTEAPSSSRLQREA